MRGLLKRFAQDASGATAVEYGLIAAGISIAIASVVSAIGPSLRIVFNGLAADLK